MILLNLQYTAISLLFSYALMDIIVIMKSTKRLVFKIVLKVFYLIKITVNSFSMSTINKIISIKSFFLKSHINVICSFRWPNTSWSCWKPAVSLAVEFVISSTKFHYVENVQLVIVISYSDSLNFNQKFRHSVVAKYRYYKIYKSKSASSFFFNFQFIKRFVKFL